MTTCKLTPESVKMSRRIDLNTYGVLLSVALGGFGLIEAIRDVDDPDRPELTIAEERCVFEGWDIAIACGLRDGGPKGK